MDNGSIVVVSVVIPNYNHAKYLKQRIDSVLNQTYQYFEIIILDDCSTDDSVQVIEAYKNHPKVSHIVINEKNSGSPFLQWKKGIALAKGDWIWIAESDDWCEPNFLEELTSKINDEVTFAFCQSIVVNQEGKKIWQTNWQTEYEEISGNEFIKNYLTRGSYIVNASMCIFQKKYYQRISSEFTKYKLIGDWVFWHEMSIHGKVVVSAKQLNYFRKHDADVSGNAFKLGLHYSEYFEFLDNLKDDKILSLEDRRHAIIFQYYRFLNDTKVKEEYRKKISYLFYTRLGVKFYLLSIKSWLVKKIKTPLFRQLGLRKPQFQNFTRYE